MSASRKSLLDSVQFPKPDFASRKAWIFDRMREVKRGTLEGQEAGFVVTVILGWADMGPLAERKRFEEWARDIDIARRKLKP